MPLHILTPDDVTIQAHGVLFDEYRTTLTIHYPVHATIKTIYPLDIIEDMILMHDLLWNIEMDELFIFDEAEYFEQLIELSPTTQRIRNTYPI